MNCGLNLRKKRGVIVLVALIICCCSLRMYAQQKNQNDLQKKADLLAHKFIIVDGHVDLPYRLKVQNFKFIRDFIGIPIQSPVGDFDYVRAKKGGLSAPFMSIYTPSSYQKTGGAKRYADSLIDLVAGIIKQHPDKFAQAGSPDEIRKNFKKGKISLPLGMENGAPIEDDVSNVGYFFRRGVRYVTLTHATDNLICDASYDTSRTWNGLSSFGAKVVQEMNAVGMLIDISHVSDSAFFQVLRVTKTPVIASHSSCRAFTPSFLRNMSDDMIKALAKNGGVIHINFSTFFLADSLRKQLDLHEKAVNKLLSEKKISEYSVEGKKIIKEYQAQNTVLFADVTTVADHIDHVRKLVGIDYVAFGSDFDGVGNSLPTGLKDVADYPNLIAELLKRGYSDKDIEKICFGNTFRVWNAVQNYAKRKK